MFVVLDTDFATETTYVIDTPEQIEEAQAAMRAAGIESLPVYVGDPDGDSHANGQTLFAVDAPTRTVAVDYENNAETWWDAARDAADAPALFAALEARDRVIATLADAESFVAWAATLPGWADGPAHARHPVTVTA